jgi:conjugal transfer pilus assembly protein TraK
MRLPTSPRLASVVACFACTALPAQALQIVEASDGVTATAVLSMKEPTRIRIDGAPITNVFGNIHSSNCGSAPGARASAPSAAEPASAGAAVNPAGEVVIECDADKGEIFVRPVGDAVKPVNLFVSSQHATYTLLLRRADTPADTIVIRDRSLRPARTDTGAGLPTARAPQHVRALKSMLVAMASDRVPSDVRVEEVNRALQLWQEVRFALVRQFEGRGLVGELYVLTNVSGADLVVAEQEFDRDHDAVLAVAIEHHNLRPGESTTVYVIRQGS